jgi:uncharacterized lipoprotein YmbA
MRPTENPVLALSLAATCALVTGCFGFLKPVPSTSRQFVLTPIGGTGSGSIREHLGIGIGQVRLPPYLFDTSLAVRKGTNEISYLSSVLWAERLDTGLQRVLAANLATLLPTDHVRLSSWRKEDVVAEADVTIARFEVDSSGHGVLEAWWRILSPGGEKTLKAGESHFERTGPAPEADPAGAVATLSDLAAELSRQLAAAIKETAPAPR